MSAKLNKTHVLAADGLNNILRGSTEELSDDRELIDVWVRQRSAEIILSRWARLCSRSFPGKSGFPSSISAKMQPVLQMSTRELQMVLRDGSANE